MSLVAAGLLALLLDAPALPPPRVDVVANGRHWRVETDRGPVHVWSPDGYDPTTAGLAIYVHGYGTTVDRTWDEEMLAEQFESSGRNALFVAAGAPSGRTDGVVWPRLSDLLDAVFDETHLARPRGPLLAFGHSAAYRTLTPWLSHPGLDELVLLDAVYGMKESVAPFRNWLTASRQRRIVAIGHETAAASELMLRGLRIMRHDGIDPEQAPSPADRQARAVFFKSQYDHMELVTDGRIIPYLLQLTRLPARDQGASVVEAGRSSSADDPTGR